MLKQPIERCAVSSAQWLDRNGIAHPVTHAVCTPAEPEDSVKDALYRIFVPEETSE